MALADGRVPATAVDGGPFLDLLVFASAYDAGCLKHLPPPVAVLFLLFPPFRTALYVGSRN